MNDLTEINYILAILTTDTLDNLDRKYRNDTYIFGKVPLLKYSREALIDYSRIIYNLKPRFLRFGFNNDELNVITKDEYEKLWTAPYERIEDWIKNNRDKIICKLQDIIKANQNIELTTDNGKFYKEIADFLNNDNDFLNGIVDFLSNSFSPLRRYDEDTEAIAIIRELDYERNIINKEIDKIFKSLEKYKIQCNDRLRFLRLSPKNIDLFNRYKEHINPIEYDSIINELDREILTAKTKKSLNKQINYINQALNIISTNRDILKKISQTKHILSDKDYTELVQLLKKSIDWELRTEYFIALYKENNKTCLSSQEYAVICDEIYVNNILLEYIKQYITAEEYKVLSDMLNPWIKLSQQKTTQNGKLLIKNYSKLHSVTMEVNEAFIRFFATRVEYAYNEQKPEGVFDFELTVYNKFPIYYKNDKDKEVDELETEKIYSFLKSNGLSEYWFDDYTNINDYLMTCLRISLNNLQPDILLTNEEQSHGAIIGMLEWANQIKNQIIAQATNK